MNLHKQGVIRGTIKRSISNWRDGKIKINSQRPLTGGFICVIPTALEIAPSAAIELLEQNQTQLAKKLILPTLLDHDTASLVMRSATCCRSFMLLLLSR